MSSGIKNTLGADFRTYTALADLHCGRIACLNEGTQEASYAAIGDQLGIVATDVIQGDCVSIQRSRRGLVCTNPDAQPTINKGDYVTKDADGFAIAGTQANAVGIAQEDVTHPAQKFTVAII